MSRTLNPLLVVLPVLALACDVETRAVPAVADVHVDALQLSAPVTRALVHASVQVTATALNNDGTRRDVTARARWGTSDAAIASVDASGLVTFHGKGEVRIGALYGDREAVVKVSTRTPLLERLVIEPAEELSVAKGEALKLSAWAVWEDGWREDVSTMVTWQATPGLGFTEGPGVARAQAEGAVDVEATLGAWAAQKTVTVTAARVSDVVVLIPPAPLRPGARQQAFLLAKYSDGSVRDLTAVARWSVSDPALAAVTEDGVILARGVGTVVIHGRAGELRGDVRLHVVDRQLVALESASHVLAPAGVRTTVPLTARYDDGTTRDVTEEASWVTFDSATLELTWPGEFRGRGEGTGELIAAWGGLTTPVKVTVTPAVVVTIDAPISSPSVTSPGQTVSFPVRGEFSDGSTADVSTLVAVSAPEVFSVASDRAQGLSLKCSAPGLYPVELTLGRATTTLTFEVQPPPP